MRNNSILARADALMNRRRQTPAQEEVPVLTDALDEEEDDIPVLLDTETPGHAEASPSTEVAPEQEARPSLPESDTPQEEDDRAHDEMIIRELTRRLEQRLAAELPRLIEATLREFVAEQEESARQQSHD